MQKRCNLNVFWLILTRSAFWKSFNLCGTKGETSFFFFLSSLNTSYRTVLDPIFKVSSINLYVTRRSFSTIQRTALMFFTVTTVRGRPFYINIHINIFIPAINNHPKWRITVECSFRTFNHTLKSNKIVR